MPKEGVQEQRITVVGRIGKKGTWTLAYDNNQLLLSANSETETHTFPPSDFRIKIDLRKITGRKHILIAALPKHCAFDVTPEHVPIIEGWLGPLTTIHLKASIKKATDWTLPLGVILVALAFVGPFDAISAGLGILMLLEFVLSKLVLHRVVLLLSAIWYGSIGVILLYSMIRTSWHVWDVLVLFFTGWCMKYHLYEYQRFQSLKTNNDASQPEHPYYPEKPPPLAEKKR